MFGRDEPCEDGCADEKKHCAQKRRLPTVAYGVRKITFGRDTNTDVRMCHDERDVP